MNFGNQLSPILSSRSKIDLLRLLTSGQMKSGRQIALELKMGVWACHRSLRELVSLGVLEMVNTGRSYLYRMNRESYIARELLIPLFEKERGMLFDFIERGLSEIKPALISLILFGSVARGDETPHSGVDLCLIVADEEAKRKVKTHLAVRRLPLLKESGNLLIPYLLTTTELREKLNHPLLRKIQEEGKLLFGKALVDAAGY